MGGLIFVANGLIMGRYYGTHVWRAAITNLHSVPVEKLIIFMMRGKVFVQQCKELFSNVGGDGCIEGWVIVDYITAARAFSRGRFVEP